MNIRGTGSKWFKFDRQKKKCLQKQWLYRGKKRVAGGGGAGLNL